MRDAPSWTSGRSWRRCSYWTGPSCTTWTQWQRLENLKKRPRKKEIGLSCKAKILQEKQRSLQKRYRNAKRILFTVTHNCKFLLNVCRSRTIMLVVHISNMSLFLYMNSKVKQQYSGQDFRKKEGRKTGKFSSVNCPVSRMSILLQIKAKNAFLSTFTLQ